MMKDDGNEVLLKFYLHIEEKTFCLLLLLEVTSRNVGERKKNAQNFGF